MRSRSALLTLACTALLVAAGCGGGGEPAAARPSAVIWAVGDGGIDTSAARQVAEQIGKDDPARVIYLGDVYESGTPGEFRGFKDVYGPLLKRMWPTPGNHDWPNHAGGYDPFWRAALGRTLQHRYARRAGGWTLLSANSETPNSRAQLRWLRRHTRGGGSCRIVFWHRPRFNAGKHRSEQRDVRRMWNAVAGRAAIVLSGHDHDMQRFKPVDGTTQLIAGAGGRSHYDVNGRDPRLAFSNDTADGALRIALSRGSADLRFISAGGNVLDHSTIACRG